MSVVTVHAAKTHLSDLLARAEAGEEIVIARGSEPVVRLVPIKPPAAKRAPGSMRGKVWLDDAFFDPLPDEEFDAWG